MNVYEAFDELVVSNILKFLYVYNAADIRSVCKKFYDTYYTMYPDDDHFSLCGMKFRCGRVYMDKTEDRTEERIMYKVNIIKGLFVTVEKRLHDDDSEITQFTGVRARENDIISNAHILTCIGNGRYSLGLRLTVVKHSRVSRYEYIISNCVVTFDLLTIHSKLIHNEYRLYKIPNTLYKHWIHYLDLLDTSTYFDNIVVITNPEEIKKIVNDSYISKIVNDKIVAIIKE